MSLCIIEKTKGSFRLSGLKHTPKPKDCTFISKGDIRERMHTSSEKIQQPNKPLTDVQLAMFTAHLEDYDIRPNRFYFDKVNRANLFHDVLLLGDDLRITVHNGKDHFKIFDVVANNKEDALAFDKIMAERSRLIKLHDEKKAQGFGSRENAERYHDIMMTGVANYRNWPEITPIEDELALQSLSSAS